MAFNPWNPFEEAIVTSEAIKKASQSVGPVKKPLEAANSIYDPTSDQTWQEFKESKQEEEKQPNKVIQTNINPLIKKDVINKDASNLNVAKLEKQSPMEAAIEELKDKNLFEEPSDSRDIIPEFIKNVGEDINDASSRTIKTINYLNDVSDNNGDEDFGSALNKNDNALEYLKNKGYIEEDYNPTPALDAGIKQGQLLGILGRQNHFGYDYDPYTGTLVDYRRRSTDTEDARTEGIADATKRREEEGEPMAPTLGVIEGSGDKVKIRANDDATAAINSALDIMPGWYSYVSNFRRNIAGSNADYTFKDVNGNDIHLDDIIGKDLDRYIDNNGDYEFSYDSKPDKDNVVGYSGRVHYIPTDWEAFFSDPSSYPGSLDDDTYWIEAFRGEDAPPGTYDPNSGSYITDSGLRIPVDNNGELYTVWNADENTVVDADDPRAIAWSGSNNFRTKGGQEIDYDTISNLLYDDNSFSNQTENLPVIGNLMTTNPNTMTDDEGNFDIGKFISNLPANTVDLVASTAPLIAPYGLNELTYLGMMAQSALNGVDPFSYELGEYDNPGSQSYIDRSLSMLDTAANTYGEKLFGLGQGNMTKNIAGKLGLNKFSTDNINNRVLRVLANSGKSGIGEGSEEALQNTFGLIKDHLGANQVTDEYGNLLYDSEGKPIYNDNTPIDQRMANMTPEQLLSFIAGAYLGTGMSLPRHAYNALAEGPRSKNNELVDSAWIDPAIMEQYAVQLERDRQER